MTRYRDGRGSAHGVMTRTILHALDGRPDGMPSSELLGYVVERHPDKTSREVHRHIARMRSGTYRGRLLLERGVYRLLP